MNCYQLFPHDQKRNNSLLFTDLNEPPWVDAKPRYLEFICSKCGSIDHDRAFAEGFEPVKIRAKGDFIGTNEGFLCVSENVRQVIESVQWGGISLKAVPETSWWVVNLTLRVDGDQSAYTVRNRCKQCGRARQTYGQICCLNQINVPDRSGTFFSPVFDRGGSRNGDRDWFVTEDIVSRFKEHRFKGACFSRLLAPQEFEALKKAGSLMDPLRWPPDSQVVL